MEKIKANNKKYCKKCDEVKDLSMFCKLNDKYHSNCLSCLANKNKEYRKINPQKVIPREKILCNVCKIEVYAGNIKRHEQGTIHMKRLNNQNLDFKN